MVEGTPLLREHRVKNSIEGSNPSLSAKTQKSLVLAMANPFWMYMHILNLGGNACKVWKIKILTAPDADFSRSAAKPNSAQK